MPVNNNLDARNSLINMKTGEKHRTKFVNSLEAVNVTLLNAPTLKQLEDYIPQFTSGTWSDTPTTEFGDINEIMNELFDRRLIPSALRTIQLTFLIEGMDLIDVTHLIRHKNLEFSSQCTGDRDMRFDDVLIKPSIVESKYEMRYNDICKKAKELYAEMMDDEDIPILDPRTILPRCMPNYYYVSGNLQDILGFIKQRKDEAIDQETMNIIALRMFLEVCKVYPQLKDAIDFNEPDYFAIETSKSGRSSNYYVPEEKNDIYEYRKDWFIRQKRRSEMNNGNEYLDLKEKLLKELKDIN